MVIIRNSFVIHGNNGYNCVTTYLVTANALKCGGFPSGMCSWYLQLSVSVSHAKMVSSLKQVIMVLLIGMKNT